MTEPDEMLALAREARERAHAPYSGHPVGAVVRGGSGRLYAGCNVESAAYPEGWCAEASALAAMVLAGERRLIEVLVLGPGPDPCPPCGGCRQRLIEFGAPETPVHVCDGEGVRLRLTLGELLPHAFALGRRG